MKFRKKLNTSYFVLRTSRKSGGFTIIEILIYSVIFSLFLFLVTQVFLTVRTTSANSLAMTNLMENYSRIFSDLNQTVKGATNVISPSPGNSGSSLSLSDGGVVYQLNQGVLEKVVSGQAWSLTDNGVSIAAINFTNVGEATQTACLKVEMTIESNYLLEGGRTITEDFQTTIGLR